MALICAGQTGVVRPLEAESVKVARGATGLGHEAMSYCEGRYAENHEGEIVDCAEAAKTLAKMSLPLSSSFSATMAISSMGWGK